MYFSTNSRYVLHRTPWMSKSVYLIKGAEKFFSTKVPSEDPTKPPLRVNIPKDSSDNRVKLMHNTSLCSFTQPRSKSVVSPPKAHTFSPSFNDEMPQKSESEIQLVQTNAEDISLQADSASSLTPQLSHGIEVQKENEYYEGFQASLHAEPVPAENYSTSHQTNPEANRLLEEETLLVQPAQPKPIESDPRTLYIIVDAPEESNKNVSKLCNEEITTPISSKQNDYAPQRQLKYTPYLQKNENQSSKKSQSFTNVSKSEAKKKQFKVHEIEDLATFVLHSRQNRGAIKTCQVDCVPEKEFTTRSGMRNAKDAPIRVRQRNFKQMVSIDGLPELIRVTESKKKLKSRKGENHKMTPSNRVEYASAQQNKVSSKHDGSEPEYTCNSVDHAKGKYAEYFAKSDSKVVRSSRKMAINEAAVPKEVVVSHVRAEEQEQTPEYGATKEECAKSEAKLKGHSSNSQKIPQVQYRDWISPRPFERSEISNVKLEKKNKRPSKKRRKMADPEINSEKTLSSPEGSEKTESDSTDFQPSASFVSIGCDKAPSAPAKFGVAFPPLLCEALKIRGRILGFRREFLFSDKWSGRFDYKTIGSKSKNKVDLSENSILFPKTVGEKFDCNAIFCSKEEMTSKPPKSQDEKNSPKISDNIANLANENLTESKGSTSVDSLTMMKKVKEIVEFDLENAIKIFKDVDRVAEIPSVMVLDGDKWRVDTETLEKYIKITKEEPPLNFLDNVKVSEKILEDGRKKVEINDIPQNSPKYLPPKKDSAFHMKLSDHSNSVITLNPDTNSFFVNKEALSEAIRLKADESFDDVISQTLEEQLVHGSGNKSFVIFDRKDGSAYHMQNGDSILVFDEENQTWKVDYSILEKREQKLRMEEELSKRSELILETFEKIERNHITKIPKPDSKQKKMFDYTKEEWKSLPQEKKYKDKKLPFKESNAEEIRRNNSDLYENLFSAKKNDTTIKKNNTEPSSDKESKSCSSMVIKAAESGSSTESGNRKNEKAPAEKEKSEKREGGKPETDSPCEASKEDNYWGSFLDMNILPKDISEIPRKQPPLPPPPPPSPPIAPPKSKLPLVPPKTDDKIPKVKIDDPKVIPPKKIEDPKSDTPVQNIEEPRIRGFFIPFIGDKKIEDKKGKIPKIDDSKKKSEPPVAGNMKEEIKIKVPSKDSPKVEDPVRKPSSPTIGSVIKGVKIKTPARESQKIDDPPKSGPTIGSEKTQDGLKKSPPKDGPGAEDPKKKPSDVIPTARDSKPKLTSSDTSSKANVEKQPPKSSSDKSDGSGKDTPREDPDKKPPETTPTAHGDGKKAPPASAAHPMVNDPKSTKSTPTIGAPKSQKDKSVTDHYVSDNILKMSRSIIKEAPSKFKPNKFETVKLNISSEKRMPSKVTEINLNKKCDDKGKESNTALKKKSSTVIKKPEAPSKKPDKVSVENKSFYKNFEKYKTPFSDPEYEEKTMKIKSDIESNPNLKKLDNWNKTLVLHDIGKPPENLENWLKDETDKMATLLLKVLQEAADGKPRKKPSVVKLKPEKTTGKGNAFEPPKKFETTPESFLFKVRTVNLTLENDKNLKSSEDRSIKPLTKSNAAGQEKSAAKSFKVIDATKLIPDTQQQSSAATVKIESIPTISDLQKNRMSSAALESVEPWDTSSVPKDLAYQNTLPAELTEEIPGPEFLKKLSNAWKMFPIIGSQLTILALLRAFQLVNLGNTLFSSSSQEKSRAGAFSKLFSKYGPVVNIQGPLSGNVVLIHRPEHITSVFEQDNVTPIRSVFDSMEQCRREADDKILSAVLSTDWSKPEWNGLKRACNDPLLRNCEKFFVSANAAGDSLISSIRKTRNQQNYVSEDFMEEIKRWSLEGLCSMIFEKSFGFLEKKNSNMNWIMEPDKLYLAINEATHCLGKCEKGFQTWRLMNTPSSSGLGQAYRSLSTILYKQLYQAEINLKNKNEIIKDRNSLISEDLTLLESMLLNDGLTMDEITCNLADIMVLGTNVMSSALGFLLYNLALNVKVQNKLFKELRNALPNKNSQLDYKSLGSLKYLQACVKESLRMHIPVPIFYRFLQTDILLSNYIIPKGTYIVMDYRVNCMKEQIFDDPEKFFPERWFNEEKWMKNVHPFDNFPICHGPRAGLAKKFIEMQLWACAAKIVRNFGVEYHYGEIDGSNSLISFPDKPLKLNFTEREA